MNKGTPQGCVLSPYLWLLYMDDLLLELKQNNIEHAAFADDIVVKAKSRLELDAAIKILLD